MASEELRRSVKEYRQLWEDAGLDLPSRWPRTLGSLKPSASIRAVAPKSPVKDASLAKALSSPVPSLSSIEDVRAWLGDCARCPLCSSRTKIVFGEGNPKASLVFVGEAPGADEDAAGNPFAGPCGELLTKIIEAMGFDRTRDTYLTNAVKCRPPADRTPESNETIECLPFLQAQIRVIKPRVVVALGAGAASSLLGTDVKIASRRGEFHPLPWDSSVAVMPTFHPSYLLKNPTAKKDAWADMKKVVEFLGGAKK